LTQFQNSILDSYMYFKFGDSEPRYISDEIWEKLDSTAFPVYLVSQSTEIEPWEFPSHIKTRNEDEIELSFDVLDKIFNSELSKIDKNILNHILFFNFKSLEKELRKAIIEKQSLNH